MRASITIVCSCFSIDEWLQLSPKHIVISRNERATLTSRICQLPDSLQIYEVKVYFQPLNDSEDVLLHDIPLNKIRNGVAEQVLITTSLTDGNITVRAGFTVGGVFHAVESTAGLTCKKAS